MIIAIFPNIEKKSIKTLAMGIREFLEAHDVTVVAEDGSAAEIGVKPLSSIKIAEINFAIFIGGDGTVLHLIHKYPGLVSPIIGINVGTLGFMADIPVSDLYPSLQDLISGEYAVEKRIMLEGETKEGEKCFAVNEMAIHRAKNPGLVEFIVHVDDVYLNTFAADGLIIATPTGSTAYSLAAGGPIIAPEVEALALTPISPHTISNRPLVLSAKHDIQVQFVGGKEPAEITFDGISHFHLDSGDAFHVRKSKRDFNLVHVQRRDYFSVLRSKLGWAGSLK
jgi:NAD+ kinase